MSFPIIELTGRATRWRGDVDDAAVASAIGAIDQPAVVLDLRQLEMPHEVARQFRFAVDRALRDRRRHLVIPPAWLYAVVQRNRVTWIYEDLAAAIAGAEAEELRRRRNATLHAKHDLTRVILRRGLGPVRFGMSFDEVRELLGEPDSAGPSLYPKTDMRWDYDDPDITITFRDVPGRGVCAVALRSDDPNLHLLGIMLNRQSFAATRATLERAGVHYRGGYHGKGFDMHDFDAGLMISASDDYIDYVEWLALDEDDTTWLGGDPIG